MSNSRVIQATLDTQHVAADVNPTVVNTMYIVDDSGGTRTMTMPIVTSANDKQRIGFLKNSNVNQVVVNAGGTDRIEGIWRFTPQSFFTESLDNLYETVTLQADFPNNRWVVV